MEPLVPVALVSSHPDPLREYCQEGLCVWAFELERATEQIRDITAAAVTEQSVKTPCGIDSYLIEWNCWGRGFIAELVFVALAHQQHVAPFQSDRITLAVKTHPAGAPFDDVEM